MRTTNVCSNPQRNSVQADLVLLHRPIAHLVPVAPYFGVAPRMWLSINLS